jgi:hypothetical protein
MKNNNKKYWCFMSKTILHKMNSNSNQAFVENGGTAGAIG